MKRKSIFFLLTAVLLLAANSVNALYYQTTSTHHKTPLEKKALIGENFAGSKSLGEQIDPNTNFYYLRARWMSPIVGRFVSVDPFEGDILAPVTLQRYLYANASPVSMSDPSGEFTIMDVSLTISIIGILGSHIACMPGKKTAWESDHQEQWGMGRLNEYHIFISTRLPSYHIARDCADLFLAMLIRFAFSKNYRLVIKHYSDRIDSDDKYQQGKVGFERKAFRKIGAAHMPQNTYVVSKKEMGPGDIFNYTQGSDHHVRIIWALLNNERIGYFAGDYPAVTPEYHERTYDDLINWSQGATGGGARRWHQFSK